VARCGVRDAREGRVSGEAAEVTHDALTRVENGPRGSVPVDDAASTIEEPSGLPITAGRCRLPAVVYRAVILRDNGGMIEKIMQKFDLPDREAAARDLAFWRSRPPGERILAVERLRRERDGSRARLQPGE
jgi:hypothetical protein